MTVGAALADPRVQDGTHSVVAIPPVGFGAAIRVIDGEIKWQFTGQDGAWRSRHVLGAATLSAETFAMPCRLVPLASADLPPDSRGPLASPRPAEAEREGRDDDLPPDIASSLCMYALRIVEHHEIGSGPGCTAAFAAAEDAARDLRRTILAAIRGAPTPARAIAAPGLDLASRVAALLAVADRATPGPWFTHDDEDTHGVESSRGTIAVCDVSPFKDEEMIRIDNMMAIATLRDAPGIIREQQAEIERLRRLAISAGRQLDEAFSLIDPDDPVALAPVSATRLAIEKLATEPTP